MIRITLTQKYDAYYCQYQPSKKWGISDKEAHQIRHILFLQQKKRFAIQSTFKGSQDLYPETPYSLSDRELSDQEWELLDVLKSNAGTLCHRQKWVFCNVELNTNLVLQTFVETSKQGATTCQVDTVAHNVRV